MLKNRFIHMPDWLLNWICLSYGLEGIMYYFANLLSRAFPTCTFFILFSPLILKKKIPTKFSNVFWRSLLAAKSSWLCGWLCCSSCSCAREQFCTCSSGLMHSKSNSFQGWVLCSGRVDAGMPKGGVAPCLPGCAKQNNWPGAFITHS